MHHSRWHSWQRHPPEPRAEVSASGRAGKAVRSARRPSSPMHSSAKRLLASLFLLSCSSEQRVALSGETLANSSRRCRSSLPPHSSYTTQGLRRPPCLQRGEQALDSGVDGALPRRRAQHRKALRRGVLRVLARLRLCSSSHCSIKQRIVL